MGPSTYRLQLHAGFTFDDARAIVPYLASLGVTTCYLSPIFTATPGSTHGYDVCRHTEINPELGGESAFDAFAADAARHGLGLLLDFVPNHMSNDPHTNDWWRDVLENGPSSPYARYFDIDWAPVKPELENRLLLPVLGEPYGDALERGALQLAYDRGGLVVTYGALAIPINPRRVPVVLEYGLDALEAALAGDEPTRREFLSVLTALRNLPPYTERDPARIAERHREKTVARERLEALTGASVEVRRHVDRALAAFNGVAGDPRSFDRLHDLLELQAYRLASWRTAADEINYRRVFDINALAGLRVEDPEVFDAIHRLVLDLVASGRADGLRLDHIDGLFDPAGYLEHLAAATAAARAGGGGADEGRASPGRPFITVEKILSAGETLRADWPVDGTTGYAFLNDVNGVFVEGRRAKALQRVYAWFTGRQEAFADIAYESKRLIVSTDLSSEFQVLAQAVNRLSEHDRRFRDFTFGSIRRALREVVACFPVYRTYVTPRGATAADAAVVDAAIADARRRNPAMEWSIFDFLRWALLPPPAADAAELSAQDRARFDIAMRFQQYTAPVQAKGLEDTAFYRHHPLVSLNEVGGDPRRFGRGPAEFHRENAERQRRWPREMLATTTHDTKRSEDARARVNVLSELPEAWRAAVARWRTINAEHRTRIAGAWAPDARDQYLYYQTLLAAWPAGAFAPGTPVPPDLVPRVSAYMHKAIKEAKLHTSWITPNEEYERATAAFVERTLTGRTAPEFLAAFLPFAGRVATAGMVNALAQLVLKLASPGIADVYQGTETWDTSLVDPDNRRPVDWQHRRHLLAAVEPLLARADVDAPWPDGPEASDEIAGVLASWPDGRIKMLVTAIGLRLRRARPRLFTDGAYLPLAVDGEHTRSVVTFARWAAPDCLVAVVPRLTAPLTDERRPLPLGQETWDDTRVRVPSIAAGRRFRNLVTGAVLEPVTAGAAAYLHVGAVLAACPVALLWAEPR
ncbi:MAG: malto-oligosyltrehalose synthase [Vicinamibacterales bacterium]